MTMSQHQHDPVLAGAFAPARRLEPTDAEVAAVVERVAQRPTSLRGRRWRWPRVGVGGVLSALGAIVAIAVAALALVLAGHSRPQSQPGAFDNAPAAAQKLVSTLAVLRRPQTAADRTLPASVARTLASPAGGGRTIVPELTRLVATVANGPPSAPTPQVRFFLIVTAPATVPGNPPKPGPALGDRVSIAWENSAGHGGVDAGLPMAWLYTKATMRPQITAVGYNIGIVPNGVTRVRWRFVDGTVNPTVHDNVALAPSMRYTPAGNGAQTVAVLEPKYLLGVTWYGPHGQVISSFGAGTANPFAAWKLVAQINLQRPTPIPANKPAGIAAVYKDGTRRAITVTALGLAANKTGNAYAVWLYKSPSQSKLLGFVNPAVGKNGRLGTAGVLPRDAGNYTHIAITLEDHASPRFSGKIVLQGTLNLR
jgi:hypothetical protein